MCLLDPSSALLIVSREIEEQSPAYPSVLETSTLGQRDRHLAIVLRDEPNWLSYVQHLQDTDVIVLLTPVVSPSEENQGNSSDPFEPLGRSLAQRHQRVRQGIYIFLHTLPVNI